LQARDATKAMAEYAAAKVAENKKTARLRELRLAKEAAEAAAVKAAKPVAKPAGGAKKKR
jgi:hypothetical protein